MSARAEVLAERLMYLDRNITDTRIAMERGEMPALCAAVLPEMLRRRDRYARELAALQQAAA